MLTDLPMHLEQIGFVSKGIPKGEHLGLLEIIGTFRSEDEYEYEFSMLSMRIRFGGRHFSKCVCSEQKTRNHSHPRPPI